MPITEDVLMDNRQIKVVGRSVNTYHVILWLKSEIEQEERRAESALQDYDNQDDADKCFGKIAGYLNVIEKLENWHI